MTFVESIGRTPDLNTCVPGVGLRALSAHSRVVTDYDPRRLEGSLDLDRCLRERYPNDNRWDYVFGYRGHAWYLEVHEANGGHSVVIGKAAWLRKWLAANRRGISGMPTVGKRLYWAPTGRVRTNDKSDRQLAQSGIVRTRQMRLDFILNQSGSRR
jgi:hypothetical protein